MSGNNEKIAKFERLAERRVTEAIKKLKLIGNLSNKNNYDYTEEHVDQIIQALEQELQLLKQRFENHSMSDKKQFTFQIKN